MGGFNTGGQNVSLVGAGAINISAIVTGGASNDVLDQVGSGTTTLSGANTYGATTEIDGGTLSVSNVSGSTSNNLGSATGSVQFGGNGVLAYTGGNVTYTRGFSVISAGESGELDVTNSATTLTVGGTYGIQGGNGGTFIFGGAGNVVVTSPIQNGVGTPLAIVKNGTGTTTLSDAPGSAFYTGTTTVNSGTLEFGQETALYNATTSQWTNSNITVANGAVFALAVGGTGQFTTSDLTTLFSTSGSHLGAGHGLDRPADRRDHRPGHDGRQLHAGQCLCGHDGHDAFGRAGEDRHEHR